MDKVGRRALLKRHLDQDSGPSGLRKSSAGDLVAWWLLGSAQARTRLRNVDAGELRVWNEPTVVVLSYIDCERAGRVRGKISHPIGSCRAHSDACSLDGKNGGGGFIRNSR